MKKLILAATAMTLIFTACKKSSNNNANSNTFKIGTTSYTPTVVSASNGQLVGSDGTHALSVQFLSGTLPTANGSGAIDNSTIAVLATNGTNPATNIYSSSGTDGKTATYTVSGGKITVTIPDIWATNLNGDSLLISGHLTQK